MSTDNKKIETRSSGVLDFSPIISEITGLFIQGLTYLIAELSKSFAKLIAKLAQEVFHFNFRIKRIAINELAIHKTQTTLDQDCIGLDLNTKRKVRFDQIPFQRHTLILGGTGFGKTTAINNIIDHNLQNNNPVIVFNPKGDISGIIEFISLCKFYGKYPTVFSETNYGNAHFNPLKNLNDSQMATLIENAFEWSDGEARYYRDTTINIITSKVFDEIRKKGKHISLPEIYRNMTQFHSGKETSGFLSQLSILMKSPFAKLLEDQYGEALSLMEVIKEKRCVYFGLSVMGYGAISRTLGKLFLGEIQIHTHTLGITYQENSIGSNNPITVIIDEAGSLYFKDLINLQNKGRSSGIRLVLATQTLADFELIDPILVKQIFNNTGCFFTFSQSNNEDAENISKAIGTYKTTKETDVIEDGDETGKGSIREVREYYVHPEVIKNLKVGQCVLFTKDPTQNYLLAIRNSNSLPSIKKANELIKIHDQKNLEIVLNTIKNLEPSLEENRQFSLKDFNKNNQNIHQNKKEIHQGGIQ